MTVLIAILLLFCGIITYTHPWVDKYTDYRGEKHITLWYTNLKGERSYINIKGSQQ